MNGGVGCHNMQWKLIAGTSPATEAQGGEGLHKVDWSPLASYS